MPDDHTRNTSDNSSNNPASESQDPVIEREAQNTSNSRIGEDQPTSHEANGDKPRVVKITKIPKIKIADDGAANNIARSANNISIVSVIVNVILTVCTIILAVYAIVQAKSSQSAATIAQNTLDETKKFNKETFRRQDSLNKAQAKSDSEKFKRDTAQFGLQKRTGEAQVRFYNETKNEFIKENEPILEFDTLSKFNPRDNQYLTFDFTIRNIGKRAVKVSEINEIFYAKPPKDSVDIVDNPFKQTKPSETAIYFDINKPTSKQFRTSYIIPAGTEDAIRSKKLLMFFAGKYRYYNFITGKNRIYFYVIEIIYYRDEFLTKFIKNENRDE